MATSASRGVRLVTGFFESLGTPVGGARRSSSRRETDSATGASAEGPTVTQIVTVVLLPLTVFFLFFQGYLGYRAHQVTRSLPLPATRLNETFVRYLQERSPDSVAYVEATIPEGVVQFLAEAEKELQSLSAPSEEDDIIEETHEFTVEAEAQRQRLTPLKALGPVVSKPFPDAPKYTEKERFELTWSYDMDEKEPAYTGNKYWMDQFPKDSRGYYNSLATFGFVANEKPYYYHGLVGVYPNGTQAWKPVPMPPAVNEHPDGRKEAMKRGGFYLEMSNALPLDREPDDTREDVCKDVTYDYDKLGDASVVITFFNEPLSTLMRSVHSVLNQTPPPLLREIILVDDHSNLTENLPGNDLYEYIRLMPKVKLMRLPERRGLVWARLAGAQAAKSEVLVVLDSHIEVNRGWLEPQLQRLRESPKSIVFPQIFGLDAEDFHYHRHSGIGCWLSWKWNIIEQASLTGTVDKPDPIPSASMAGGLFAVRLDWFWEIGGYDELFAMWGSENVEMGFRVWQCGGRMECTPCARTYHIYRKEGIGYSSPSHAIQRNKLRTARAWMDEWYQVTTKFLGHYTVDMGNLDNILALKERLKCKSFKWFLENVDPNHDARNLSDIQIFGEIRNKKHEVLCVDLINGAKHNVTAGTFHCHEQDGTQGYFKVKTSKKLRSMLDETKCLVNMGGIAGVWGCYENSIVDGWEAEGSQLAFTDSQGKKQCLAIRIEDGRKALKFVDCDSGDLEQQWGWKDFEPDPNFAPPDFSIEYKKRHGLVETNQD